MDCKTRFLSHGDDGKGANRVRCELGEHWNPQLSKRYENKISITVVSVMPI